MTSSLLRRKNDDVIMRSCEVQSYSSLPLYCIANDAEIDIQASPMVSTLYTSKWSMMASKQVYRSLSRSTTWRGVLPPAILVNPTMSLEWEEEGEGRNRKEGREDRRRGGRGEEGSRAVGWMGAWG